MSERNSNRQKEVRYRIDKRGCHICISHSCTRQGYPQIQRNKKKMTIVRFLWLCRKGSLPKAEMMHKCDNKKCINLAHIKPGTAKENMSDASRRGLLQLGERHHNSKLTERKAKNILASRRSTKELAIEYGVTVSAIRAVKNRRLWRHVSQ